MTHPFRSPLARAAAHRAMARAALFSDSSAAVRLKRYNHHMSKARRLASTPQAPGRDAGAMPSTSSHPATALAAKLGGES